jgi:hypothetical protein
VQIYQSPGESKVSEHPCSFHPSNSVLVNVKLHQILQFKHSFSKQTSEVGDRQPLLMGNAWIAKSTLPMVVRSCDFVKSWRSIPIVNFLKQKRSASPPECARNYPPLAAFLYFGCTLTPAFLKHPRAPPPRKSAVGRVSQLANPESVSKFGPPLRKNMIVIAAIWPEIYNDFLSR